MISFGSRSGDPFPAEGSPDLVGGNMNYFTYGANLSKKRIAKIAPAAKPKFSAVLPNYKLIFTGYSPTLKGGTASIKPFKGQRVSGAIYEVTEADLRKIDSDEEYPTVTNHMNVIVWTDSNDPVEAITYIKKEQSTETKPSPEYLNIIREGYKDWQIE
jgi:gamma-glutamylcyclotransferase